MQTQEPWLTNALCLSLFPEHTEDDSPGEGWFQAGPGSTPA